MMFKLVWFLVRLNLRFAALMALIVLVLGCVAHTDAGLKWVVSTPLITMTDPNTGDILHKFQPVRVVAMTGYMLVELMYEQAAALLGRYL